MKADRDQSDPDVATARRHSVRRNVGEPLPAADLSRSDDNTEPADNRVRKRRTAPAPRPPPAASEFAGWRTRVAGQTLPTLRRSRRLRNA